MASFSPQVGAWAKDQKEAAEAIFHDATQAVANDMQTTVGEGGNMPVITGFLRWSLTASSDSMPQIREGHVGVKDGSYPDGSGPINLIINNVPVGGRVFLGYTAAYAARVNYGFSGKDSLGRSYKQTGRLFVEQAAQRWPEIVKRVEKEAENKLK